MGHGASIFGGSVACDMAAGQKSALSLPPLVCQTNKCSTKIEGPRKRAWFRRSESYYTDNFTTVLQKLSHTTVTPSRLSPKTRMYVVGKRLHPFLAPRTQVFMECILGITVVPAQGNPYNSRTMSAVTSVASTIVNIRAIYVSHTSVGSLSPVSSTVAVCPYLAMSVTSPPMLSSVVVFTGRHKPSGASTKPCMSALQTPSVTVNGSAVCPQVKNKELPQTNEAGRKRGGGEPSYAAKRGGR